MSKTLFTIGTVVQPPVMTALMGTDGSSGIIHDGQDIDGHAPKIVLTSSSNVTGVLPVDNMGGTLFTTVQFSLDNGSTYSVNKAVQLARVGNVTTLMMANGQDLDEDMTAVGPLLIRPQVGDWPFNIFGNSNNIINSNYFRMLVSPAPTPNLSQGYMIYSGSTAPIEVRNPDGSAFNISDNIRIFGGSYAAFSIELSTITP